VATRPLRTPAVLALAIGMLVTSLTATTFASATVTILNRDGTGEGLNDPTAVSPVGGNTGTTLGAQRLNALRQAANIWGGLLNSGVEIRVEARFDSLFCDGSSATLGQAGPNTMHRDFAGAPLTSMWYPQALANRLAGADLDPGTDDIGSELNSAIDAGCLPGLGWYYGLDANPPSGKVDLVTVALHELAHGFGFLSVVDPTTGHGFLGFPDAYMTKLEDHSTGNTYQFMTDPERATASIDTDDLHWIGPNVAAASSSLIDGRRFSGHVDMYAPNPAESGSSVSHYSNRLLPDELMEPGYTGPNHDVTLTAALLADIGWSGCGNGVGDPEEACDDGNNADGDGCSQLCQVEQCFTCAGTPSTCTPKPNGTPCNDGITCTAGETCSAGVCGGGTDICPLDHYKCYQGTDLENPPFARKVVQLADQFQPSTAFEVQQPKFACIPVNKNGEGIINPSAYLTCYQLKGSTLLPKPTVDIHTQFQVSRFEAKKPKLICVPSTTETLP